MKKYGLAICTLFVLASLIALAQNQTPATPTPPATAAAEGLYTAEQATAGEAAYNEQCAMCHGSKLEGVSAPALSGTVLAADWGDALALYEFYAESMPPMAPGKLGEEAYINIMAYILKKNDYPQGKTKLVAKPEVLRAIKFKAPASK